jgi:hypothetical protein
VAGGAARRRGEVLFGLMGRAPFAPDESGVAVGAGEGRVDRARQDGVLVAIEARFGGGEGLVPGSEGKGERRPRPEEDDAGLQSIQGRTVRPNLRRYRETIRIVSYKGDRGLSKKGTELPSSPDVNGRDIAYEDEDGHNHSARGEQRIPRPGKKTTRSDTHV